MGQIPEWWLTASGAFFVLGSAATLVSVVALAYLIKVLADLRHATLALGARVEKLTEKVDGIAEQVRTVTTEVGARTTGIVRLVDEVAGPAVQIVERFAPLLMGLAAVGKIFAAYRTRRRA
ncbi:MAG: hypothetical protein KF857_05865 [Fimbriimonadaceae bacterium]|nr:hypothetical protein [Fimbriimonadaceae bacterium]